MVNRARLITCKTADLTWKGQARSEGIIGDTDLAGIIRSKNLFEGGFVKRALDHRCFMG
jgi:hypothetical protein